MIKVVFDTVVFVRSLLNPHNYCGRVLFQSAAQYRLFLSPPVLREILEVLHRDELTSKFRSLAGMDMAKVLDILAQAEVVEIPVVPAVSRDPKDNKFLATAVAAGAAYLVSQDEDLTDLKDYRGIQILTCEEFLEVLGRTGRGPR
jgi:putative PIN family toxin of toxin-antitoxin system